jgi:hypothetical protein
LAAVGRPVQYYIHVHGISFARLRRPTATNQTYNM